MRAGVRRGMGADPRIVSYLKQYGQRFSPEQLVRSLRADGWPQAEVEAALAEVGLSRPPPLPFEQKWAAASEQRQVAGELSGMRPLARGHPPLQTEWKPVDQKVAPLAAQAPAGLAQSIQRGASMGGAGQPEKKGFLKRLLRR